MDWECLRFRQNLLLYHQQFQVWVSSWIASSHQLWKQIQPILTSKPPLLLLEQCTQLYQAQTEAKSSTRFRLQHAWRFVQQFPSKPKIKLALVRPLVIYSTDPQTIILFKEQSGHLRAANLLDHIIAIRKALSTQVPRTGLASLKESTSETFFPK